MITEHRFISFDETPVFYRRCTPLSGPPRGILIILHGMGEHSGRYLHVMNHLAGEGFESFAMDLRGSGQSGGRRGHVRRFLDFHRDVQAFHAFVARTHADRPIFFLGHSFGGLVVSSYLAFCPHSKVQGVVLSSPIFGIAVHVSLWRHWLGIATSVIAPWYTQQNRVVAEILTHDKDMLADYERDPWIHHKISAKLYFELIRMIGKRREIAQAMQEPVLIVQAGEDKVVSREQTEEFFKSLSGSDKELKIYPGYYHEVLNEVNRRQVLADITSWLFARISF